MNRDEIQARLADALSEKYEIVRWIGGGGMAQVFLARNRILGALFAVKVLNVDLAEDDRIVARFMQEAQTAVTLSGHPNIVPVFDVCKENGLYFFIMQYVEGDDLATYLQRQKKLDPSEATEIVLQVAGALVWASAKGVVHRDLKPSNLYLNQSGQVMVLDFGIAKTLDVPSPLTLPKERLGTPYYMSPEQIRGESCDTRSDLYSLGVVFFELLTGRRPFEGSSNQVIMTAHKEKPPPDLSKVDRTVPRELYSVVAKLLAKDPNDRYQSPKELIDDLRHPPPPPPPRPVLIATLAVILAAAAFLIWRIIFRPPTPPPWRPDSPPPRIIPDKLGEHMLLVHAGNFTFGDNDPISPNEKETATLPNFYIDETEVSNGDYRRFCQETGHRPPGSQTFNKQPDFPITNVSFEDAEEYAKWIGKRIPSEKEWEKAARGPDGRVYPWGNEIWTNAPATIEAVLSNPNRISPYGVFNMAGNVAEWTTSHYPVGPAEVDDMTKVLHSTHFSHNWRVIKGGYFGPSSDARLAWKTYMRRGFPEDVNVSPVIGFRCVQDAK